MGAGALHGEGKCPESLHVCTWRYSGPFQKKNRLLDPHLPCRQFISRARTRKAWPPVSGLVVNPEPCHPCLGWCAMGEGQLHGLPHCEFPIQRTAALHGTMQDHAEQRKRAWQHTQSNLMRAHPPGQKELGGSLPALHTLPGAVLWASPHPTAK